jgi:hypothetical protein
MWLLDRMKKLLPETLRTKIVSRANGFRGNVIAFPKPAFRTYTHDVTLRGANLFGYRYEIQPGIFNRKTNDLLAFVVEPARPQPGSLHDPVHGALADAEYRANVFLLLTGNISRRDPRPDIVTVSHSIALQTHEGDENRKHDQRGEDGFRHARTELVRPAEEDVTAGRLERCACPGAALEEEKRQAFALAELLAGRAPVVARIELARESRKPHATNATNNATYASADMIAIESNTDAIAVVMRHP